MKKFILGLLLLSGLAHADGRIFNADINSNARIASSKLATGGTFTGSFVGDLSGNAATCTAFLMTPTGCGLNQAATGIDASGNLTCQSFGGSGTVTTVSVATANGFAGTVANATSTPAITISTSCNGICKGNGTAISTAVSNTDYQAALGFTAENVANKDTDGTLAANSDTSYASQKATKTYADTKAPKSAPAFSTSATFSYGTASTVPYFDASKNLISSAVTPTELGYLSGVTSALQTQLGLLAPKDSPAFTTQTTFSYGTLSTVPYWDASKHLVSSAVTPTELGYVSGVTSALQTQLNAKASSSAATTVSGQTCTLGSTCTIPFSGLSGSATGAQIPNPSSSTLGGVQSIASATHNFLTSISTSGVPAKAQPAVADLSDGSSGSGAVVLVTSATLITPALGTPSALVGTNITGTASGLTAGNVTTNANLTGDVTSSGNATTIGAGKVTNAMLSADNSNACSALSQCTTARTIDWSTAPCFTLKLTSGSACTLTFSNPTAGARKDIWLSNDSASSGTATLVWPTAKWFPAGAPTMTTGTSALDVCSCTYNGTSYACNCLQNGG